MTHIIILLNVAPGIESYLREGWGNGFTFVAVETALELFEEMSKGRPSAIVTDNELPGLTGTDVARSLGQISGGNGVPVALIARTADHDTARLCTESGASLVIDPSTSKGQVTSWFDQVLEASKEAEKPPYLDQNMAASMAVATNEVMSTMLGMNLVQGKLRIEKTQPYRADVIGSISVSGFLTGGVSVFMGMDLASTIAATMLGYEDESPSDEELVDAVGELTNMIAGNIKTSLCRSEDLFSMSSPSVLVGREIRRVRLGKNVAFLLPFFWRDQELLVEFNLIPKRRNQTPVAGDSPVGVNG